MTAVVGGNAQARLDFLLAVAAKVAHAKQGVLIATKQPVEEVSFRMLAARSGLDADRLIAGHIELSERNAIQAGAAWLWNLPVALATDGERSLKAIVAEATRQLSHLDAYPNLVILDDFDATAEVKAAAKAEGVVVLVGGARSGHEADSLLCLDTLRAEHSAVHVTVHRNGVCLGGVTLGYDPACGKLVDDEDDLGLEGGSARWWQEEGLEDQADL